MYQYICPSPVFDLSNPLLGLELHSLKPWDRLTSVFPTSRFSKNEGALMSNQSFLVNGSTTFFLIPFFPFESLLFFPTAILRVGESRVSRVERVRANAVESSES